LEFRLFIWGPGIYCCDAVRYGEVPSVEGPLKVGPPLGTSISLREKERERERERERGVVLFLLFFVFCSGFFSQFLVFIIVAEMFGELR